MFILILLQKENVVRFFLSHWHTDHLKGLKRTWAARTIYCSYITAQILSRTRPFITDIYVMEQQKEIVLPTGDHVIMYDANHMVGNSIFFSQLTKLVLFCVHIVYMCGLHNSHVSK